MKKTILFFTVLLISALNLTSCVSTNKAFQSSPVVAKNVQLDPIKADIQVNETAKLQGESSASYLLFFRISGDKTFADGINYSTRRLFSGRVNKVRSAAAYKAINSTGYDVLVHPNYTLTVENYVFFRKYNVKVEGYGAKYTNFRTEKQKIVIIQEGKEVIVQD
jgi:hypothetical protein